MSRITSAGDAASLDRWLLASDALDGKNNPLTVPFEVALEEAAGLARFVRTHWEPTSSLPGLRKIAERLPLSTADDLVTLAAAVGRAQTTLLTLVDPAVVEHGARARFVVAELESAIAFALDEDLHERDEPLQPHELRSQDGHRSGALAQALRDYGSLAASLRDRIEEADRGFDAALIDDAEKLAAALDAAAADPAAARGEGATAHLQARNRLLVLLEQTKARVRRAGAHVFRAHPEVARELANAHDHRRCSSIRRRNAKTRAEGATTSRPPPR